MGTRWLSIAPTLEEILEKAKKQGVYVKIENCLITKDEVMSRCDYLTLWHQVYLHQKDYGKTWAFTREELENEIK